MKGLRPVDFEVRDNGQVRPILSLRADLRSPISLAILVDMSGSMSIAYKIDMARQAYDSILSQLHARDEVALFAFDSELHVRREFTSDLSQLRGALSTFEPFGSTSLYDATAETARKLAARSATHKAIIVLTDVPDTSSRLTASEVSGLASSIDVPVYIVATVPSVDHRAMLEATERDAALRSGGPPGSGGVDRRPARLRWYVHRNRHRGDEPRRRTAPAVRPRHRGGQLPRMAADRRPRQTPIGRRQSAERLLRRLITHNSPMDDAPSGARAGLCDDCRHARMVVSSHGSTFYLCKLSEVDRASPDIPVFPYSSAEGTFARLPPITILTPQIRNGN